jgi:hypothetical protein
VPSLTSTYLILLSIHQHVHNGCCLSREQNQKTSRSSGRAVLCKMLERVCLPPPLNRWGPDVSVCSFA